MNTLNNDIIFITRNNDSLESSFIILGKINIFLQENIYSLCILRSGSLGQEVGDMRLPNESNRLNNDGQQGECPTHIV
jgi:hypothetical protein